MLIMDASWFKIEMQEDIHECYLEIYNKYKIPRRLHYLESHVFDEEKSVRWNREEVVRQNQLIEDAVATAVAERAAALDRLDEAVVKYIMEDTSLNEKLAKKVLEAAKNDHDDNWWDYIDDLAFYTESVISAWKESMND
jgi:uncharacterized protein with von Willebrand factor type A (vWA) domain